jgi:hypothetical protein
MITHVYGGEFLAVQSSPGSMPYISTSQPMTGLTRYTNNRLEVYDGSSWMQIGGGNATINLSAEAIGILQWAKKKMAEEAELIQLSKDNPTIKDLYDKIKMYEDQLKMVKTLIKEEQKV